MNAITILQQVILYGFIGLVIGFVAVKLFELYKKSLKPKLDQSNQEKPKDEVPKL